MVWAVEAEALGALLCDRRQPIGGLARLVVLRAHVQRGQGGPRTAALVHDQGPQIPPLLCCHRGEVAGEGRSLAEPERRLGRLGLQRRALDHHLSDLREPGEVRVAARDGIVGVPLAGVAISGAGRDDPDPACVELVVDHQPLGLEDRRQAPVAAVEDPDQSDRILGHVPHDPEPVDLFFLPGEAQLDRVVGIGGDERHLGVFGGVFASARATDPQTEQRKQTHHTLLHEEAYRAEKDAACIYV